MVGNRSIQRSYLTRTRQASCQSMDHGADHLSLNIDEAETWRQRGEFVGPSSLTELHRKRGDGGEVEVVEAQMAFMMDMAEENSSDPWSALQHFDQPSGVLQHEFID